MIASLEPHHEKVRVHYKLPQQFFEMFLGKSMVYSTAYFQREDMTLEEAQLAKDDLTLGKCDLRPGMRLLDIGCGWGSTLERAVEKYEVDVVGLTLSESQKAYCLRKLGRLAHNRCVDIRLQAWEEFDEPVDRIVSIETFEHFRQDQHQAFFARCRSLLPSSGRMVLHAYVRYSPAYLERKGISLTHEDVLFGKFICRDIFPGRQLVEPEAIIARAEEAGFQVLQTQALQPHYARTFGIWAENLAAVRREAIALTSPETFDRFLKYLSGCAECFRRGQVDVIQFTLLPD